MGDNEGGEQRQGEGHENAVSEVHEIAKLRPLTLSQVRESLKERGTDIALSTLSEFLKTPEAVEILQSGGGANRREFPPAAVEVLAAFLPQFRESGMKWSQAPAMLRAFVKQGKQQADAPKRQPAEKKAPAQIEGSEASTQFSEGAKARIEGRARGLAEADQVWTAQEAADFLRVTVSQLRKTISASYRFGKSPRGDRWLKSRVLEFVATGGDADGSGEGNASLFSISGAASLFLESAKALDGDGEK